MKTLLFNAVATSAFIVILAGCMEFDDTSPCKSDDDCLEGRVCLQQKCTPSDKPGGDAGGKDKDTGLPTGDAGKDAGYDTGLTDSGATDTGVDSGTDAAQTDTGIDASVPDGGLDATSADVPETDSGETDAGETDAGTPSDTGTDSGDQDAGTIDAGSDDTGTGDAGTSDTGADGGCVPVTPCGTKCSGFNSCGDQCNHACVPPETCGGGAISDECGCTGETDIALCGTKECGTPSLTDKCNAVRTPPCGTCTMYTNSFCNTGTWLCDCASATCIQLAMECGDHDNKCGGTVSCPTCSTCKNQCVSGICEVTHHASSTCSNNDEYWFDSCGAKEELKLDCTAEQACYNGACCTKLCSNKCAGTDSCGGTCPDNCQLPETCGGGGVQNQCGCTPVCAGKCGGDNSCNGTCPDNCVAPETCSGAGVTNVCGIPPGACHWSKRSTGDANENIQAIARDSGSGAIYISGMFSPSGNYNFGGGDIPTAGDIDIFLTKFSKDGVHLLTTTFGDTSVDIAYTVAVDPSGDVLLGGGFAGTINFGCGDVAAGAVIVKFNNQLQCVWSRSFSGGYVHGVATDAARNVYVVGEFGDHIYFADKAGDVPGVVLNTPNNWAWPDVFVAKFDPSGKHLWSKNFGGSNHDRGYGIAIDQSSNVLVTGFMAYSINFGGGEVWGDDGDSGCSYGCGNIFLAKLDTNGNHVWSKGYGGRYGDYAYSVAVDSTGNVYFSGGFTEKILLNKDENIWAQGNGGSDAFVAKMSPTGNHIWSKTFGDSAYQFANNVAVRPNGDVGVVGSFEGTMNLGGADLVGPAGGTTFIGIFDSSGTHKWSKPFGGTDEDNASGIIMTALDGIIYSGSSKSELDFGCGLLSVSNPGKYDSFLVKLEP